MRNLIIAPGLLLALSSCTSTDQSRANIYGGLVGQSVVGNSASVSVANVWREADALPLADRHCAQFDKVARMNRMSGYNATFDCVKD